MSAKQVKVSQPIGIVSALVCLAIVTVRGGNPVALKVVLQYLSPMPASFARKTISSASIAVYALARGVSLRPERGELRPLAFLSVLYALQIGAMQTGADYTSPLYVAILFNTYPIVANLTSSFFVPEDRLSPRRVLGLVASFVGVTWVFLARTESALAPNPVLGNSLVLGAATLLALRMVYLRQLVLRVDYVKAVFWPGVGALPLFLIGWAVLPDAMTRAATDRLAWTALLYQGLVLGGAGQLVWAYLMKKHTPGTVIAFSFMTPVMGLALSSLYFSEPVPPRLVGGLGGVLAGIALAARPAHPTTPGKLPGPPRASGRSPR